MRSSRPRRGPSSPFGAVVSPCYLGAVHLRSTTSLVFSIALTACAGSSSAVAPEDDCAAEAERATQTQGIHERCAAEGGDVSEDEVVYQALMDRLQAHQRTLAASESPSVSDEDAMAVADGYWAYLDRVASQFTDHAPLDRAEDAAEALMRDRTGDEAIEAVSGAREALEALHAQLVGEDPPVRCAEEAEIADEAAQALAQCRDGRGGTVAE